MDESPTGCWTNHQSIVQFKDQWYLFYHHNDLSPGFDKARSVRIDKPLLQWRRDDTKSTANIERGRDDQRHSVHRTGQVFPDER